MAKPILPLGTSTSAPIIGNPYGTKYVMADNCDETGVVITAHCIGYTGTIDTTTNTYQLGCTMVETDRGSTYLNVGSLVTPSWHNIY